MPRLFFAVRTPENLRIQLRRVQDELAKKLDELGARFKIENLNNSHCTLRFLGNVKETMVSQIIQATKTEVERMQVGPFRESLTTIGAFTHRGQTRVLWVGLSPIEILQRLREAVDAAVGSFGIPIEREDQFHPHLTLIRFREPFRLPHSFAFPEVETETAVVSEIELVESKTLPQGAVHSVRAYFQL